MKYTIKEPIDSLFDSALRIKQKPTLIITDTHAPYQNTKLLEKAFELARSQGITQLVHAGDLIDAASYNTQAKGELTTPIETDIEHARSLLYTAQQYFSIIIMPGNHDLYYVRKEKLTFEAFIKDVVMQNKLTRKIKTTERDYIFYGDFAIIGHLSGYSTVPGEIAAQIADKYNMHALVGHDHIRGMMKADNGKYGISIGGMFAHNRFWYKERGMNIYPHSDNGFIIIADKKIQHYNDKLEMEEYT